MIPGILAQDVAQSLREFIVTGFETDTWPFSGKFEELVNSSNNSEAFIKGPYVSINLPFAKSKAASLNYFSNFSTENSPYIHQQTSWDWLRSDKLPKSTIVATGTGSGKTECFLYPLLDHCQRNTKPGIKAIVIYPMNALAGDQAKRFASVIDKTPELKGKIRVGLFIGGADETEHKKMESEQVITCKKTLRRNPPDILLTNYKMLDYLLMRPKDQQLWQHNDADSLKYLVVDELHTFDGAQGSDLAMLIRRLKARLGAKTKQLACVGTSATLGSESQMEDLADYASDIFDTHFDQNSIIGESRESQDDFISDVLPNYDYLVLNREFTNDQLKPDAYTTNAEYLNAQVSLFFGENTVIDLSKNSDRVQLGHLIKESPIFRDLLSIALKEQKKHGPPTLLKLFPAVERHLPDNLKDKIPNVLISMLSLLAHARGERYQGEPFVTARLQLWARELRRIVARIGNDTPQYPVHLQFSDDLKAETDELYLPIVQCTECHTTAWVTRIEQGESQIEQDLRKIYTGFFSKDKQIRILLPLNDVREKPPTKGISKYLCCSCGELQTAEGACVFCKEEVLVPVFEPDLNKSVTRGGVPTIESQRMCPVCQADSSLLLFGARAASLSSVAIHQIFSNPINDDKKLIAFSDSVQDAAHRSGFFAARTWQNNIRMSIAKTVSHYTKTENKEIALTDLFTYLPNFWLVDKGNLDRLEPLNYITQFIAPSMQTFNDYVVLKENGLLDSPGDLINQINRRFVWEVLSEFGMRSLMGRSLERTGVATLTWDAGLIENASSILQKHCSEGLGQKLSTQQAEFMLWGVTLKMKRQGAIFDPLLKGYIESGGDYYLISRKIISFMPDFGNYSILPKFPAEAPEKGLDRLLPNNNSNWYSRWVLQLLGGEVLVDNKFIIDLLHLIMKCLVDSGLCLKFETRKENNVWGLNPEKLYITTDVSSVRLQRESSFKDEADDKTISYGSWHIPKAWEDCLVGLPSMDQVSHKDQQIVTYNIDAFPRASMYKDFYLKGEINRVIGHEHTALLERDYREALEKRFMSKPENRKAWYENLLSATPTLEMGIDIGDLSSVLLCSVPPTQANYLQRAGRGGRRDGNSFVLTLANGHPHDLYFYADPLKMLAGEVQAPAIFLNASMVLKRQLLAFCFDQWGVNNNGQQIIPNTMQPVIDAVENKDLKKFPYTLLEFISVRRDELWEGFLLLLGSKVTDTTKLKLKEYMLATSSDEDALHVHVLNRLQQIVGERKLLINQQKDLESELRALKRKPQDEARDELERELTAELGGIKGLKWGLNKKRTLNFFTDDGLLPNYAFPEEGTTLHSVIFRRLTKPKEIEDGKTTNYDSKLFEYSRPAHSALSELAPESIFYASNRKVEITRVEMAKGENLEHWRLCPSCNFSEQILGIDQDATCPRCNDPMWADQSQLIPMVRLKQVYANTSEDKAFIDDGSDTREPTFFNRQMLIDFDPEDITEAYAMKTETKPFGFEFIKKASFKEINFGKQGGSDQVFNVAGKELARPGFRLCKECGTVQSKKNKVEHMYKCQYRNAKPSQNNQQIESGIIECLYLYRQYESEAIRILMPRLSFVDREEQLQSFVAALQLGLKARYGGKVDHLHIMISDEPIPGSEDRASYLVIYDTVPGGTGYLHDLLKDSKHIIALLTLSRDIMAACSCQELPDVDGCYNCLYAYKNSYGMEHTSRNTALAMLAEILDENVELERVTHLGKINKNIWADSELEARFPEAIQALSQHAVLEGKRIRTTTDIINGKTGFKLEIGDLIYSVEIHPRLGEADGVAYPCEPDFLITLDRESDVIPPIAVFLDGYRYHKNIVHEDLMKRQGIFLSRKYLTWSLTWYDINHVFAGNEAKIPNVLRENIENSPKGYIRQISESKGLLDHNQIAELHPLLMLLRYLSKPNINEWQSYAAIRTLCWLNKKTMQDKNSLDKLMTETEVFPNQYMDQTSSVDFIFSTQNTIENKSVCLKTYIAGGAEAVKSLDINELMLAVIYQVNDSDADVSKRTWQKLLQVVNLGQFLPNFFAGTEDGITDGSFSKLSWSTSNDKVISSEWDTVFSLVDEEIAELLIDLSNQGVDIPDVGYEIENESGVGVAEAELAWVSKKVVLLMDYQIDDNKKQFEDHGWLVFTVESDLEIIIEKLRG
jgi:DEAD/DEAH box helicase domain-containing protein